MHHSFALLTPGDRHVVEKFFWARAQLATVTSPRIVRAGQGWLIQLLRRADGRTADGALIQEHIKSRPDEVCSQAKGGGTSASSCKGEAAGSGPGKIGSVVECVTQAGKAAAAQAACRASRNRLRRRSKALLTRSAGQV